MQKIFPLTMLIILSIALAGCGYTPEQRAVSGAALGGATGAAIGAATHGGAGAALAVMTPMATKSAWHITAIETRQLFARHARSLSQPRRA
jgi:hypothetical protein